jgi:hypothetical protein
VKPLVGEAITTILITCPGASMLFYRAALSLSAQTLSYVAGVIRRHRAKIGSCWRKLNPGRQAAGGDTDPLVGLTVSAVVERVRALSPAARRRLGTLAQLREDLQREVTRQAHVLTDRLGQWQAVEQVLRSRLEVEVEADKLQESRVESIQELDVTVTVADAEEFIAATDGER